MNTFETPCVRGYHIYEDIWTAAVGEILFCMREPTNASDRYAAAVTQPGGLGVVIEHLLSKIFAFYKKRINNYVAFFQEVGDIRRIYH